MSVPIFWEWRRKSGIGLENNNRYDSSARSKRMRWTSLSSKTAMNGYYQRILTKGLLFLEVDRNRKTSLKFQQEEILFGYKTERPNWGEAIGGEHGGTLPRAVSHGGGPLGYRVQNGLGKWGQASRGVWFCQIQTLHGLFAFGSKDKVGKKQGHQTHVFLCFIKSTVVSFVLLQRSASRILIWLIEMISMRIRKSYTKTSSLSKWQCKKNDPLDKILK